MLKGIVKWFNNPKGYGFIQSQELTANQDVLIHYSVIVMEGFKTLKAGQMVKFLFTKGPKGLIATKVLPYDENEDDVEYCNENHETLVV